MSESPKRIVISLDGTWNSPAQEKSRDDGSSVLKPSNPLKICRAVRPWDAAEQLQQITYYSVGVGALGRYPGVSNRMLQWWDNKLGGAWGAGFERNIEDALTFLVNNYREGDQVFVFGFSRGAAQARALTRFLDWLGGLPAKRDAYWLPHLFRRYIVSSGTADAVAVQREIAERLQAPFKPITIELLAVWDTVMALGSRFRADRGTSVVSRSFHVDERPASCVRHARQALAVDEQRYDFRPEIWTGPQPGQSLEQRWFAGAHSNVGGGLVHDGLANISLRWILAEAEQLGLVTSAEYTKFFKAYPQDRYYPSRSAGFRVMEAARLRFRASVRPLVGQPETAGLHLDKSVVQRLCSDPTQHERLQLYRPRNVLELLAAQDDRDGYLESLGLSAEQRTLPDDVVAAIDRLR